MSNLGQALLIPGRGKMAGLPVTAGLVAWYSADKITGLNNGDPVASWPDSSGNGNAASQATQSQRPTWTQSWRNGRAAVSFDGVDDNLITSLSVSQPNTLIIVAAKSSLVKQKWLTGSTLGGSLQRQETLVYTDGDWRSYAGNNVIDGTADTNPHILQIVWNGASSILSVDGNRTTGNMGSSAVSAFAIGMRFDLTGFGDYTFGQIAMYNRALSSVELSSLDHYLGSYYNIAVSD